MAAPAPVRVEPGPAPSAPSAPGPASWVRGADVAAGSAFAGYVAILLMSGELRAAVAPPLELAAAVAAALTVLWVGRALLRRDPRLGRAWLVLGSGFAAYAAGDALWVLGGATLQTHPLSLPMHLAYLAFYPLFLAGVLGLPRIGLSRDERLKLLLDAALVVLAAGSVLWMVAVRPYLAELPASRVALTLAYPLADLVLVWAVLVLAFRRQSPGGGVTACLVGSAVALVVGDVAFSAQVLLGRTDLAAWPGVLLVASHLLAVLAAVRQLERREPPVLAMPRPGERSLAVAWAAFAAAWVVILAHQLPHMSLVAAALATAALALVATRQVVAVGEIRTLYRRVRQVNEGLEERVEARTRELGSANIELRRRLQELTALSAVSSIAIEAADEDELLERTTIAVRASLFPDNCGILLLDDDRSQLHHTPCFHSRVGAGAHQVIPLGRGVTGWVAASGVPRRVADTTIDPDYLAADPEMRSELCVPLKVAGRVLGVIDAESHRPDAFSASDELVLTAVAGQLATAIERLRSADHLRRQLRRIAALREIDAAISSREPLRETLTVCLRQALELLGLEAAAILLADHRTGTLRAAATLGLPSGAEHAAELAGCCHAARAVRERRTVTVADLRRPQNACQHSAEMVATGFTGVITTPLLVRGDAAGVLEVYLRGEAPDDPEWLDFLEALAGQAAIAVDNRRLFESIERSNRELAEAYDVTLEGWSRALELRDQETQGHAARVTALAVALARAVGIGEEEMVHVRRGALLHDIGKMGIPDGILLKPGPLDEDEWAVMRRHPELARRLLAPIPFLAPALDIPYGHHERWDGSGYPQGLAGEAIPLAARVFAVVDVWDALCHDRPYRRAWPPERVQAHLLQEAGRTLDARVVERFLRLLADEDA